MNFADTFFADGICQPPGSNNLPGGSICDEDSQCASNSCIKDDDMEFGTCDNVPTNSPVLSPTYSPTPFPTPATGVQETSSPVAPPSPNPPPSPTVTNPPTSPTTPAPTSGGGANNGGTGSTGQSNNDNKTNTATIIGLSSAGAVAAFIGMAFAIRNNKMKRRGVALGDNSYETTTIETKSDLFDNDSTLPSNTQGGTQGDATDLSSQEPSTVYSKVCSCKRQSCHVCNELLKATGDIMFVNVNDLESQVGEEVRETIRSEATSRKPSDRAARTTPSFASH